MTFFNPVEPVLRCKQHELAFQDAEGCLHLQWRVGYITLLDSFYTRIDQVFVVWGLLTLVIFGTAQFLPLDWALQAMLWTGLSLVGAGAMVILSWFWVVVERVAWLLGAWVGLVVLGLAVTDLSIFYVWGDVLLHLGPLWLGLMGVGYLVTGTTLRSRALVLTAVVHGLSALVFFFFTDWQFLGAGLVQAGSLFLLSECQWDMRLPQQGETAFNNSP
ncbi:hypothetical protein [Candidatus Cyanaurora vandensis]|uniref:hypothetical protein n=1 Tax=Candidatus Cyanaurora vandensis TaxID=2714958 RepID=UPI00257F180F|nr:hypothetical protein [Candidatus Cyanaurora vandensis]